MLNRHGAVIGESPKVETKIFSKQTAWYMTKMLEGVVKEGTAKAGVYNGALAGKTGTTSYQMTIMGRGICGSLAIRQI